MLFLRTMPVQWLERNLIKDYWDTKIKYFLKISSSSKSLDTIGLEENIRDLGHHGKLSPENCIMVTNIFKEFFLYEVSYYRLIFREKPSVYLRTRLVYRLVLACMVRTLVGLYHRYTQFWTDCMVRMSDVHLKLVCKY